MRLTYVKIELLIACLFYCRFYIAKNRTHIINTQTICHSSLAERLYCLMIRITIFSLTQLFINEQLIIVTILFHEYPLFFLEEKKQNRDYYNHSKYNYYKT